MAAYKNLIIGNVEVVFTRINQRNQSFVSVFFNPFFEPQSMALFFKRKKSNEFPGHFFGGVVRFPVVMLLKSESGMRGITLVKRQVKLTLDNVDVVNHSIKFRCLKNATRWQIVVAF